MEDRNAISDAISDDKHQTPYESSGENVSRAMVEVVCVDRLLKIHKKIRVPAGTILLDALKKIDFIHGLCGGIGKCGRCIVEIEDGILVQSCYYRVTKNITVRKWRGV